MTAMRLHRYPSPSGGFALGKMGVGATMLKQGKTARDYVQDGLVAMWDGIENAGWGTHDPNAVMLKDLIGSRDLNLTSAALFDSNALVGSGAVLAQSSGSALIDGGGTTEVVLSCAQRMSDTSPIVYFLFAGEFHVVSRRVNRLCNGMGYIGSHSPFCTGAYLADLRSAKTVSTMRNLDGSSPNGAIYINAVAQSGSNFSPALAKPSEITLNAPEATTKIYCVRIYSRALTASEIASNYAIDKERFNLP